MWDLFIVGGVGVFSFDILVYFYVVMYDYFFVLDVDGVKVDA